MGYELLVSSGSTGGRRGLRGVHIFGSTAMCRSAGFSMPVRYFKSHSLVWLCESDIYLWGMGLQVYLGCYWKAKEALEDTWP